MVARYNPCGAPVDIGRVPFAADYHLYPDSDEVFRLVWSEARADVPFKRGPNAITNLKWDYDRDEYVPTSVGEIFGTREEFRYAPPNPLATGGHTCGTEADFAGDGAIDLTSPPVEYRPDGLPLCCGDAVIGAGGLVLGGTATVINTGPYWGYGGVVLGGTALVQQYVQGSGGLVIGGSAVVINGAYQTSSGGIVLGGEATTEQWVQGSGGLVLGGEATVINGPILTGSGGLVIGGSAYASVWEPCFTVTPNCVQAMPLELGHDCSLPVIKSGVYWMMYDTVIGTTYRFEMEFYAVGDVHWILAGGPSCSERTTIIGGHSTDPPLVFDFVAFAEHTWVRYETMTPYTPGNRVRLTPLHGP